MKKKKTPSHLGPNLNDARRVAVWAHFRPLVVYGCCGGCPECKRTTPPRVCEREGVVTIKWRKTRVDASNDNGGVKTSDRGVNRRWRSNSGRWGWKTGGMVENS